LGQNSENESVYHIKKVYNPSADMQISTQGIIFCVP